ncbi:MAG: hypothetical protein AAF616_16150 [Bacteroidota bacterium]
MKEDREELIKIRLLWMSFELKNPSKWTVIIIIMMMVFFMLVKIF